MVSTFLLLCSRFIIYLDRNPSLYTLIGDPFIFMTISTHRFRTSNRSFLFLRIFMHTHKCARQGSSLQQCPSLPPPYKTVGIVCATRFITTLNHDINCVHHTTKYKVNVTIKTLSQNHGCYYSIRPSIIISNCINISFNRNQNYIFVKIPFESYSL